MTARSFTEAFAAAAEPLDIDAIEARLVRRRLPEGTEYVYERLAVAVRLADEDVPTLVAEVRELRDSRERAIRWAVTLEGQNAAAEKVLREFVEVRGDFHQLHPLAAMVNRIAAALDIELRNDVLAALTGSTE